MSRPGVVSKVKGIETSTAGSENRPRMPRSVVINGDHHVGEFGSRLGTAMLGEETKGGKVLLHGSLVKVFGHHIGRIVLARNLKKFEILSSPLVL